MFENKLNTITLSGKEYPMKCSILVLEKIQDKYGTLEEFEAVSYTHLTLPTKLEV